MVQLFLLERPVHIHGLPQQGLHLFQSLQSVVGLQVEIIMQELVVSPVPIIVAAAAADWDIKTTTQLFRAILTLLSLELEA